MRFAKNLWTANCGLLPIIWRRSPSRVAATISNAPPPPVPAKLSICTRGVPSWMVGHRGVQPVPILAVVAYGPCGLRGRQRLQGEGRCGQFFAEHDIQSFLGQDNSLNCGKPMTKQVQFYIDAAMGTHKLDA